MVNRWIGGLIGLCLIMLTGISQAARTDLKLGMQLEPPHLDPTAGAAGAIDEIVYANLFEGLTRIDQEGRVKPSLATNWDISKDRKTYSFTLRKNVTFHDGTTFDADDVIFSLNRIIADGSVNAKKKNYAIIENVTANGTDKVVVKLKQPISDFLFRLGLGDAVIVAPESAETNKVTPIGTGPFQLKRWLRGDRVELKQYPNYWGKSPALQSVTFKFIPDPAASVAALLAGDVDAFNNFPAPESLVIFERNPRFTVKIGTTEGETILAMNNTRKPFNDIRVRQAIAHALDRQTIIEGAMFGYGKAIGSHFAPHNKAYSDLTALYPYDLSKAKARLKEANLANGFKATLKLPPPFYARRSGEIITAELKKIGIKLEIIPLEWAQWLEQVFTKHDYDLTIVSHTEANDIDIYSWDNYYFNYKNQAFDQLMDDLNKTHDKETRIAILHQAQRILAEDAVNGFLFQLAKQGVWNAKLQGMWDNAPIQANDVTGVSWMK